MEEWLAEITVTVALVVEAMALLVIAFGSADAFVRGVVSVWRSDPVSEKRAIWQRYARWLVAGLTFQLAADLLHTAIAPTWDDIGQLAAIAGIRTFLNFFLERDMRELREESPAVSEESRRAVTSERAA